MSALAHKNSSERFLLYVIPSCSVLLKGSYSNRVVCATVHRSPEKRARACKYTIWSLSRNKMPSMKDQTKIVIVGGVAGGMSAATRSRRLDENASITVFERGPYVSYANCGIPYALGGEIEDDNSLLLQSPEALKSRFNIDVYTRSEALDIDRPNRLIYVRNDDNESVTKVPYDKLILSQGAQPWRPSMEGIDLPLVFSLQTVPDLKRIKDFLAEKRSNNICIIGGGFIGLE